MTHPIRKTDPDNGVDQIRYTVDADLVAELDRRFRYHPPVDDQPDRYHVLRGIARRFADDIVRLTPDSRERSLALTNLEQAVMWANAAIARRETRTDA